MKWLYLETDRLVISIWVGYDFPTFWREYFPHFVVPDPLKLSGMF